MKKKILGIVLSLTMVGAMLAGCGQQQGAEDKKEETKTEDTKTDDTEKADDADKKEEPADESKTEGSGKFAPVAKEDLKVGVIHITDPAEGSGYTYTHDQGIVEMQKELGLEDSRSSARTISRIQTPPKQSRLSENVSRTDVDHFRNQL